VGRSLLYLLRPASRHPLATLNIKDFRDFAEYEGFEDHHRVAICLVIFRRGCGLPQHQRGCSQERFRRAGTGHPHVFQLSTAA
jgi:hypothetical protein